MNMKKVMLPGDMRVCEARYFEKENVRSIDAMERAAEALAVCVREMLPKGGSVWCVCGSGGNGGDGIACARILKDAYRTKIILPKPPRSRDALENLRRAEKAGVEICENAVGEPDLWVDALFGTGFSGEPEGICAEWIDRMNGETPTLSADIPSGLNGETGKACRHCVRAARTVSFGFAKAGLCLQDGLDFCGNVTVAPIGFPESDFDSGIQIVEKSDIQKYLPERRRNIYKNQCGHILIVAGSYGMAGAAAMCARGAMRSGAGLVTLACPESIVPMLQTLVPGAMCAPIPEKNGAVDGVDALLNAFSGKMAAVVGCGLSMRANPNAVRAVLQSGLPAVVDADALNLIAANGDQHLLSAHHIITPHPGEARRLLLCESALLENPIAAARALSAYGACALFKGAACVISDGKNTYISASGASGMARGGSGDVLSGVIGALIAEKSDRSMALNAALGSEIHGLAGELAQRKYGSRGMIAEDLPECIAEILNERG